MAKAITVAVQTQQAAQEKRPTNLIILSLDTGTLRYAASKTNVVFPAAGNIYTAKTFSYSTVGTSLEGQISRVTVKMDNTVRDMMAYADSTPFKGRDLVIWKVYRNVLANAVDYEEVFNGIMEEPSFDYNWISIPVTAGANLGRKYPL